MKKLFPMILIVLTFSNAFSQKQKSGQISDYFNELPQQYKTFSGDISAPTEETTIIDNKNGYATYLYSPEKG